MPRECLPFLSRSMLSVPRGLAWLIARASIWPFWGWLSVVCFGMRFFLLVGLTTVAMAGEFTVYVGDNYPRSVAAMTTDGAGNTYIVGNRSTFNQGISALFSSSLSTFSRYDPAINFFYNYTFTPDDVFVSKLDPAGKILFTAVFAGKGADRGLAVATDAAGNVYIAGATTSPDFPLSNALQSRNSKSGTGFIVKLSPDGRTILYSTYFGGVAGSTRINAMTTDAAGNLYLTGTTSSIDFPITPGMPTATVTQTSGSNYNGLAGVPTTTAAFVTSMSPAGDKILFSGMVGGTSANCSGGPRDCGAVIRSTAGISLALDRARNVYFGGNTNTTDLPTTTGGFLTKGIGGFAGKIAAGGTGLTYLTYVSSASEILYGPDSTGATILCSLTADNDGNAYLAGVTGDPKFPVTPGAFQTTFAGGAVNNLGVPANTDGFVAKLNPAGDTLAWASYLGGSGNDVANSVAVDAAGAVWVTGTTASPDFPNSNGWSQGGDFLTGFSPSGAKLQFSARYPDQTVSQAVAVDAAALVHLAGGAGIVSTIATATSPSAKIFGVGNVVGGLLAGRVAPAEVISLYGPNIGPATAISATPTGGFFPTTLGGIQVIVGGIAAPLLYASPGQINAVVPMGLTIDASSTIQITGKSGATPQYPLWIDFAAGQIFPGVINQNGTLNSQENPAKVGTAVSIFATGFQTSFASVADGQIVTKADDTCSSGYCYANRGTIVYLGAAPGLVAGITQVNLRLDDSGPKAVSVGGLSRETIYISLYAGSATVQIWVTP